MKKEILRIQNLNIPYQERRQFHWINMILFEGECTAFLGLSFSGKDDLVNFLTLRRSCNVEDLGLRIDTKPVLTAKMLEKLVYRAAPHSQPLPGWTCAEYISLAGSGWILMGRQNKDLVQKAQEVVTELCIGLDVRRTLSMLTEKEKRLAELARACALGARVLVVEDELEGLTEEEINEYAATLQQVARKKHLTVIINAHSREVSRALADHYMIFRDGMIVKKCRKAEIVSRQQLEMYMLGSLTAPGRDLESDVRLLSKNAAGGDPSEILYRMRSFPCRSHRLRSLKGSSFFQQNGSLLDLSFRRSCVTTILVLNEKLRDSLFLSLSGRETSASSYCVIGDMRMEYGDYRKFVRNRVISVMHLGSREELFGNMSIGENLVLPSLRKISFTDYLLSSSRLTHALDASPALKESLDAPMTESDVNSRIAVTLDRWYLYNPKVMIFLEPFERCDLYGISIVRSYIRKIADQGACVIIIKSRAEYTEDISDEILRFDYVPPAGT